MTYYLSDEAVSPAIYRVTAEGEVDLHARPGLEERLERAIESRAPRVVLDLSEATFIDSTAVRVLLQAMSRLRGNGRQLELVCHNPNVLRILQITGVADAVPVHLSWKWD